MEVCMADFGSATYQSNKPQQKGAVNSGPFSKVCLDRRAGAVGTIGWAMLAACVTQITHGAMAVLF